MISAAIYRLSIWCYDKALRIAARFNPKAAQFVNGRHDIFSRMQQTLDAETRPRVWMHCASLGEFEQGRPVLEKLRNQYPNYAFVLTFFSPSGYEVRKDYTGADHIFYLPIDSDANARKFLDIVRPQLAIFVKYELWYYYLNNIAKRKIPAILISAIFRKDQLFFKWYGKLFRKMLGSFQHVFVQDPASEELLKSIELTNTTLSGDTRFDRVIEAFHEDRNMPFAEAFVENHKVIVAGSTWRDDEVFLQKVMQQLPYQWKLILVPHEVHESHIAEIERLFSEQSVRLSKWDDSATDKNILIVDKIGLLFKLYGYATVAWIGGGFGKEGVHNVLEAAVYGTPCAYGPVFHQFIEAEELITCGGGITTKEPEAFVKQIVAWDEDMEAYTAAATAAKSYVTSRGGATQKVLAYVSEKKLLSTL